MTAFPLSSGVKRALLLLTGYLVVAMLADLPPFQDRPRYWQALIERERLWLDFGDSPNPAYSCFDMDVQVMWIKFLDDGWSAEVVWTDQDDKPREMKLPFVDKQVFGTEVYASGLYRLTLDPEVRFVSPARHIGPC